jgi:hypothetical protein
MVAVVPFKKVLFSRARLFDFMITIFERSWLFFIFLGEILSAL